MPADLRVSIRQGETRPVYGKIVAPSGGTVTIASGGKYTLYDTAGVVTGHNDQDVTGYDASPGATARAWKTLDTSGLAAGAYKMVFKLTVTASVDGITRVLEPVVVVRVEPKV